jgi:hypothetical protein
MVSNSSVSKSSVSNNSMGIAARGGRVDFTFDSPELQATQFGAVWLTDDSHGPLAVFIELGPNIESSAHHHESDYITVVVSGALRVGRKWFGPGSVRVQEKGSVYGPSLTGPEGVRVVVFFSDRHGLPDQFAKASEREMMADMMEALGAFGRREGPLPGFLTGDADAPLVRA